MKKYIIIAGVNGAGKSTLYQTLQTLQDMPRVNTDEILRKIGDWENTKDVITAGKIAVGMIENFFSEEISFNQETTLCGKSILKNISRAKSKGYFVELHYVGVDTVEIAKERVRMRVERGGHGIPEKDIERRYVETFANLKFVISKCDIVSFYDNTEVFRRFAIYKAGVPVRMSQKIPYWYKKYVC